MHDKLVSLNQDGCPFEICYVDEGTLTLHFYREIYIIHNNMWVLWQTYLNKFRFVLLFFLVFYVSIKVYLFRCWKGGLKYEWIFLNKKYYAYILHRKLTSIYLHVFIQLIISGIHFKNMVPYFETKLLIQCKTTKLCI